MALSWQPFEIWFEGLVVAAITAAANTITTTIVAPEAFNFHAGLPHLMELCGVNILLSVAFYLKQKPLPGVTEPTTK